MTEANASPLTRYQVIEALGPGQQARSFVALDRQTDLKVALKIFDLKSQASWRAFERFEQERDLLAKRLHPALPQLLDSFAHEQSGTYALVMELVIGTSLQDRITKGQRLSEPELWHLLGQGLDILAKLHAGAAPVIHRDIKPEHLVIQADGRLRLLDLGAAAAGRPADGSETVFGTPGYAAPEQSHGAGNCTVDYYSFAASLLAGYVGQSGSLLPRVGLEFDLSSLALQPGHKQLLAQMLRADPRERIGDIAQLRAAYAQCSTPQFGQPTPNSATGPSQQFPREPQAGHDEHALMPSTWLSRELVPRVDKLAKEGSSTGKIAAWTGLTLLTWFAFVFQVVLIPLGFLLSRELQNDNRPELEREKHRWLHEAKSAHETLARAARSLESALR